MKRVINFFKPFILVILGGLLLLNFLNAFPSEGAGLALAIVGVVIAAFYLAVGILNFLIQDKLPPIVRDIFDIGAVVAFPTLMFVLYLLSTINLAQIDDFMGPTAWTIAIASMLACLALIAAYILLKLVNIDFIERFMYLFSGVFVLALILNIVFDARGDSNALGGISLIMVAIDLAYVFYLYDVLVNEDEKQPAPQPAPAPAVEKEEQPEAQEEAPEESPAE